MAIPHAVFHLGRSQEHLTAAASENQGDAMRTRFCEAM
jgi:hypothetical protein